MASVLPTQISFESARLCSAVRPAQSRQRVVVILSRGRVELRGVCVLTERCKAKQRRAAEGDQIFGRSHREWDMLAADIPRWQTYRNEEPR